MVEAHLHCNPLLVLGIACLTLLAFGPSLWVSEFTNYDDETNYGTRFVQSLSPENMRWAVFDGTVIGVWEPVSLLAKQAIFSVAGVGAPSIAIANIVVHSLNLIGMSMLAHNLLGGNDFFVTSGTSTLSMLIIGLHPLRAEAVSWLSCLPYLLSCSFSILTIICHTRNTTNTISVCLWKLLEIFFFACAMMSKLAAVSLVLALIWGDLVLHLARQPGYVGALRFSLSNNFAHLGVALGLVVASTQGMRKEGTVGYDRDLELVEIVGRAFYMVAFYTAKTIWPTSLHTRYPIPDEVSFALPHVGASAVFVIGCTVYALWSIWKYRGHTLPRNNTTVLSTAWIAYMLLVSPTLGLVTSHVQGLAADRYSYLPSMLIFAPLVAYFMARVPQSQQHTCHAIVVVLLSTELWCTRVLARTWRSSESLWMHVLAHSPNDSFAQNNLGNHFYAKGRQSEAKTFYEAAISSKPDLSFALFNYGRLLHTTENNASGALTYYQRAIAVDRNYAKAHLNVGTVHFSRGDMDAAITSFENAVHSDPTASAAYNNIASAMLQQGRDSEALPNLNKAVQINPRYTDALVNRCVVMGKVSKAIAAEQACIAALNESPAHLSVLYTLATIFTANRPDDAIATLNRAIEAHPAEGRSYYRLGNVFQEYQRHEEALQRYQHVFRILGAEKNALYRAALSLKTLRRTDEARSLLEQTISMQPDNAKAISVVGDLMQAKGGYKEAVDFYSQALTIDPQMVGTISNLGVAYHFQGRLQEAVHQQNEALRLQPNNRNARTNLDAAKNALQAEERARTGSN
jgi:tetratricopeptide (TPR) repeat protein